MFFLLLLVISSRSKSSKKFITRWSSFLREATGDSFRLCNVAVIKRYNNFYTWHTLCHEEVAYHELTLAQQCPGFQESVDVARNDGGRLAFSRTWHHSQVSRKYEWRREDLWVYEDCVRNKASLTIALRQVLWKSIKPYVIPLWCWHHRRSTSFWNDNLIFENLAGKRQSSFAASSFNGFRFQPEVSGCEMRQYCKYSNKKKMGE